MPPMPHAEPTRITHHFMPACNSLLAGIICAAYEDCCLMMKTLRDLLVEIWLETVYNTATLIQRFR